MTETFTEIDFFCVLVFSIIVWLIGFGMGRMSND